MSVVMSVKTRSMRKAIDDAKAKAMAIDKADAKLAALNKKLNKKLKSKSNTNKYNLRTTPSVNYADISSDDDEKEELKEEWVEKVKVEKVKEEVPLATLATTDELTSLNLTPCSKDPSGEYNIVMSATKLEYIYVCQMGKHLQGKWAIAPPGYYWKHCSEKCYYWFDWVELRRIPV